MDANEFIKIVHELLRENTGSRFIKECYFTGSALTITLHDGTRFTLTVTKH